MTNNSPYLPNFPVQGYQAPITNTEFHFIQGENAAKAYPIMPGNTGFLFDSEESKFYIKSVNFNGMPNPIRIFKYEEEIPAPKDIPVAQETNFVTKEDFDAAISELKSLLEKPKYEKRGGRNNAQSDIRRDER